jgi:acyl-CoA thioesterase-1
LSRAGKYSGSAVTIVGEPNEVMMAFFWKAALVPAVAMIAVLPSGWAQSASNPLDDNAPNAVAHPHYTAEQRAAGEKAHEQQLLTDWADLAKYREADAKVPPPAPGEMRVVFMGDSITENWGQKNNPVIHDLGDFFPGKPYYNRGISGQTSPQMLVRFWQDVIDLKPKVVVILAGANDIAENTGPMTMEATENNIRSMVDLARANGIRVVLSSVLPASDFWWHPGLNPAPTIKELNAWIEQYAGKEHLAYVDYYSHLVNSQGGMKAEYSPDGVHPNGAGYAVMAPLAQAGIRAAMQEPGMCGKGGE